jgi:hypothetical protein
MAAWDAPYRSKASGFRHCYFAVAYVEAVELRDAGY